MNSPSFPSFNAASSDLPIGRTGGARTVHAHERAQRFDEALRLLDLPEERLEIIELEVAEGSPAAARAVKDLGLPDGSLVISILREGGGFVPTGDSVIEPGDEVLVVLDVGIESRVTELFTARTAA